MLPKGGQQLGQIHSCYLCMYLSTYHIPCKRSQRDPSYSRTASMTERVSPPCSPHEVAEFHHPVLHFGLVRGAQSKSTQIRHKLNFKLGRTGSCRFSALLNS